ncbi:MAG TPA: HAMP domain-containing sensor histidine kinase [Verrucomicrobiota bacterium]|mgnify:CR=1 FL=1|nr:HAMP domain-containing sensor histidine kinase [Verrucomicrobiota bacterium]HQB16033.1 HAMP domain-containing sensor histidine kinase [Verrucomicrobiota bacterium]
MAPGLYAIILLLVVFIVTVLVRRSVNRPDAPNWHRQARLLKYLTIYWGIAIVAVGVVSFTNQKPFWPQEAIIFTGWLVALGCQIYVWRYARLKAAMSPPPPPASHLRPPGGGWQAILILLPMAGLVWFGLYSLRQDRLLAEQEAREAGENLAQRLALAIGIEAAQQLRDYCDVSRSLRVNRFVDLGLGSWKGGQPTADAAWRRIKEWQRANPEIDLATLPPADVDSYWEAQPEVMPPQPPEWLEQLTPEQQQLWQAAKAAEFVTRDFSALQAALEKFIATKPPEGARANAEYLLLLAKTQPLSASEAVAQISEASRSLWGYSDEVTESGLPVGQLISYQALRRLPEGASLPENFIRHHTIARKIESRPSIFSPLLIAETERVARGTSLESYATTLKAWWDADTAARQVLEDFREQYPTNTWNAAPFWVDAGRGKFLLLLDPPGPSTTNSAVPQSLSYQGLLFPQAVVEKSLATAVHKARISLPPYARVEFETAKRKIVLSPGQISAPTNHSLTLLGQADGTWKNLLLNQHAYPFRVRVLLASPEILYARQSQRTRLFGALIVLSALATLIGLIVTRRAFLRQLRLNEMKSNFVSSVSHELRAPIAAVRLMAENLERGKVNEPARQRDYFRFIGQECRRLSALIENVLDFSRIEQGRKQYEFEPTDLVALVEQTVKLMQPYAAEKGVQLKAQIESPRSEMEVDGRALQQALVNLVDNAIKHSPLNAVVTVALENAAPQQQPGTLNLSVTDHGPGIPASEREKIFERFHRLGSELRRETQGVGIGLSIVKHIVAAHGGRVRVESKIGMGSRFTIELPEKIPPRMNMDERG